MMLATLNSFELVIIVCFFSFLFLAWGSFLNVVAYRLLHGTNFWQPRSQCSSCKQNIAWYDLIPVFSWLILRGKCRWCKQPISSLYAIIELITLCTFWGMVLTINPQFWFAYGLFFSALMVTIRTDLEAMIILRPFTLGIIPAGWLFSYYGLLPITVSASMYGTLVGYSILAIVRYLSYKITGHYGMGDGDPELLAAIGAFVGPFNCWLALTLGSFFGSLVGIILMWRYGAIARKMPIPFGPFLTLGAIICTLLQVQSLFL